MNPFESDVKNIISHLEEAHAKISTISNPEMPMLRNKILVDLKRHINSLKIQVGVEPDPILNQVPTPSGPIKKMFGRDLTKSVRLPADVNKPFHQSAEDVEEAELRLKRDELYPRFVIASSDVLLDSIPDIEIRAVAKRAGLPVTENSPAKVDKKFVDQVKAALKKSAQLNELAGNV